MFRYMGENLIVMFRYMAENLIVMFRYMAENLIVMFRYMAENFPLNTDENIVQVVLAIINAVSFTQNHKESYVALPEN